MILKLDYAVKKKIYLKKTFKILFLLITLYLIISPFLPEAEYQVRQSFDVKYEEEKFIEADEWEEKERVFDKNVLIIPEIGVNINIIEGNDESALSLGAWRRPNTGTPLIGGNTVITGHRFQYLPPNNKTFYNLDKLSKGSKIFIHWEKEKYTYVVYDKFVVEPTDLSIEDMTSMDIVTLYTCHPIWTAKQRLVIRAKLSL